MRIVRTVIIEIVIFELKIKHILAHTHYFLMLQSYILNAALTHHSLSLSLAMMSVNQSIASASDTRDLAQSQHSLFAYRSKHDLNKVSPFRVAPGSLLSNKS